MNTVFRYIASRRRPSSLWADTAPVRDELFGIERLEQHAQSLANAQPVTKTPAAVLLAAYRASADELEKGRGVVPAAEWLLDNYHLVEEQIREIREDLPAGFYRQLGARAGELHQSNAMILLIRPPPGKSSMSTPVRVTGVCTSAPWLR